ncbi:uncharacterized protein LOC118195296 [Stegodyphus dumicola]|uniref:uncharacterized protein LOC118195296 n=1 Tax=Stegodyphus dumicola TaxID=202533 RepID=UPI0015A89C6F|nr:uncharacterized protein LOC118195296 [Stegodyphus dumicola]
MRRLEDAGKNGWTMADFSSMMVTVDLGPQQIGRKVIVRAAVTASHSSLSAIRLLCGPGKIIIEALETPEINQAVIGMPRKEIFNYCKENSIRLADATDISFHNSQISVLIGNDYYWKLVTKKVKRLSKSLVDSETIFCYAISGTEALSNVSTLHSGITVMNVVENISHAQDLKTSAALKKRWDLDAIGILDYKTNENDTEVMQRFEETTEYKTNRYEVSLPWKGNVNKMGSNYNIALNRWSSLLKRFKKNPEIYDKYSRVIEDYLNKGISEKAPKNSAENIYYLPHHCVIREDHDSTKLRVVFDASWHTHDSLSLNDCLHSGPNLNPELVNLLIKFR